MKSIRDRITTLDAITETAQLLSNVADFVLADIEAARGEAEQEHRQRPKLLADIRDEQPGEPTTARPDEPRPIHDDPTGEAAMRDDPATTDLAELDKRIGRALGDLGVALNIFRRHQAARTPEQIKDARTIAERALDDDGDWCTSHLRVGTLEPVEVRKQGDGAGKPYYVGMCRRCGSLLASLKKDYPKRFNGYDKPPIELVMITTYRKLREADIEALVGPQHRKGKKRRYRPGEDRKRKAS